MIKVNIEIRRSIMLPSPDGNIMPLRHIKNVGETSKVA